MRIYLDDVRSTPQGFTHRCYTAQEAIQLLQTGECESISFDHDLGQPENGTGYDVAKFIEEQVHLGRMKCPDWHIHSGNPVGAQNIQRAMLAAAAWEERHA
jgi:hypothetical protein